MARMIKVHVLGRETKDVDLREAQRILEETYADPFGGLVVDKGTGEVIREIGPNVQELLVINEMMGGG